MSKSLNKILSRLGIQEAYERGQMARIVILLCLAFLLFGSALLLTRLVQFALPALANPQWADLLLEALLLCFGLVALLFLRKQKMRAASWVVLGGMLAIVSAQAFLNADPANDITSAMGLQLFAILCRTSLFLHSELLCQSIQLRVLGSSPYRSCQLFFNAINLPGCQESFDISRESRILVALRRL